MSRTDKDRPRMVRANDPYEKGRYRHHYHWQWGKGALECDFAEAEKNWVSAFKVDRTGWHNRCYHCGWQLSYKFSRSGIPGWFTHSRYFDPERVRERDALGEARKMYRADPDMEDFDFFNRQHRHGAAWDWD